MIYKLKLNVRVRTELFPMKRIYFLDWYPEGSRRIRIPGKRDQNKLWHRKNIKNRRKLTNISRRTAQQ